MTADVDAEGNLDGLLGVPEAVGGSPDPKALKPKHQIATVRLSRDNPEEQWLVKMLLSVESDLREFNQPMVFPT